MVALVVFMGVLLLLLLLSLYFVEYCGSVVFVLLLSLLLLWRLCSYDEEIGSRLYYWQLL